MRRLKTKHQRLLSAVSTLRGELESFLKDDDDIAKMCLSRRADLSRDLVPGSAPLCTLTLLLSRTAHYWAIVGSRLMSST